MKLWIRSACAAIAVTAAACNLITGSGDLVIGAGGEGGGAIATGQGAASHASSAIGAGVTTTSGAVVAAASGSVGASTSGTTTGSTVASSSSAVASSSSATAVASSSSAGGGVDAYQDCVDIINSYRASIGLAPYARWSANESCVDGQAKADEMSNTPHSAFGQCGESAQDECPGWPAPPEGMIGNCLAAMWAEGPGADFSKHGHYINMSSTSYTMAACGYYTIGSSVWATQDFR